MDRRVQVRRKADPPLWAVYLDPEEDLDLDFQKPDYELTRIWLGVVPPETSKLKRDDIVEERFSPGYACVVGEIFDNNPMQRVRHRVVFDEAICLDPRDFTPEECAKFDIPGRDAVAPVLKQEDRAKEVSKGLLQVATIDTLRQAVIALKDLWWPEKVLCPYETSERFFRFMQNTDGLYHYDLRYNEHYYREVMPCFKGLKRTTDGVLMVEQEDREYNQHLVDALLAADRLTIMEDLDFFWKQKLPTAYRAIGMVLAEMQLWDLTYQIRDMNIGDGYAVEDPRDKERLQEEMSESVSVFRWWAGENTEAWFDDLEETE